MTMTIDDLKQLQDDAVKLAQRLIKRDGDMAGLSFIVTHHGNLDKLKEIDNHVEPINPKQLFQRHADHDVVMLCRPWPMDWKDRFNVLYHAVPQEHRGVLDQLLMMSKTMNFEDDYIHVARPLMKVLDVEEKDVVGLALKQICAVTDAIAIINVSTAWCKMMNGDKDEDELPQGALEDDLASEEVLLVLLEAHAIERQILIPIKRRKSVSKKRDGGPVTGWGKPIETSTERTPDRQWTGRFFGLLKPLKSQASS